MRQEAVQQALAAMKGKTKAVPLPSKRISAVRPSDADLAGDSGEICSYNDLKCGEKVN